MTEHNVLVFSANGSGVVLRTKYSDKHGGICFTTTEFHLYQRLFKIADNKNQGKLVRGSTQLNTLLIRTDLEWDKVDKICTIATSSIILEEDCSYLDSYRWLVVCKCIGYCQKNGRIPDKDSFKKMHGEVQENVPIANFNLDKAQHLFVGGKYSKAFKADIPSWRFYEHVKFKIINVSATAIQWNDRSTRLAPSSAVAISINSNNGKGRKGGGRKAVMETSTSDLSENGGGNSIDIGKIEKERNEVERRYSEFEALVHILQRHHMGYVIPPVPVKSWPIFSSDTQHEMRRLELLLFLEDIIHHPALKYSFELKSFLECSSGGFKEFVELYAHLGIEDEEGKEVSTSSALAKLISNGAAAVITGASAVVANHKSLEVIQSIWGYVSQTVSSLIAPSALNVPNENAELFESTAKYLESVAVTGRVLESIVALDKGRASDLAGLSLAFKNMCEFETVPSLVRLLRITNRHVDKVSEKCTASLLTQSVEAQLPLQYAGRYAESYRLTLAQRAAAVDVLQAANKKMYDAEVTERNAEDVLRAVQNGEEVEEEEEGVKKSAKMVVAAASSAASAAAASTAAALRSAATSVVEVAKGVQHSSLETKNSTSGSFGPGAQRSTSFELIDAPEDYVEEEAEEHNASTATGAGVPAKARGHGTSGSFGGQNGSNGHKPRPISIVKASEALNQAKLDVFKSEETYETAKAELEKISDIIKQESPKTVQVSTQHATQALCVLVRERARMTKEALAQWTALRDAIAAADL